MDRRIFLLFKITLQNTLTPITQKIIGLWRGIFQLSNTLSNHFSSFTQKKETSLKDYFRIYKYYISKKLLLIIFLLMIISTYSGYKFLQSKGFIYETFYETDNITHSGKLKIYDNRKDKDLIYKGTADKGLYSGYGELYSIKGKKFLNYKGQFKNNEFSGFGILYNENGSVKYKGTFSNNKFDGYGENYYDTGKLQFKGNFKDGFYNGYGKKYYENGIIDYVGIFSKDLYNGSGTLYSDSNKIIYCGEFKSGLYEGKGQLFNSNKNIIFKGKFSKGIAVEGFLIPFQGYDKVKPKGKITIFSTTDEKVKKYEGEFDGENFQGKGILYFEDKDNTIKYQGDFKDNLFDGVGTLYDISKAVLYKGYFKEGKPAVENFIGKSDVQLKEVLGEPDKADKTVQVDNPDKTIALSTTTNESNDSIFNYSEIGLSFVLSKNNSLRVSKVVSVKISSSVDLFDINANMTGDDISGKLGTPNSITNSIDGKTANWIYNKDNYILTISFANQSSNASSIEVSQDPSIVLGNFK